MKAAIISIGDELVLGQTVDTNSAHLSRELAAIGCDTAFHMTVGDDEPGIEAAIRAAIPVSDVILLSGGLGPTADDLTRNAIAAVLGEPLELRQEWLSTIEAFFTKLGRVMPKQNEVQAMLPKGSKVIWNPVGTACGIEATIDYRNHPRSAPTKIALYAMPGVPKEMKAMFAATVGPAIAAKAGGACIRSVTLHTFGLGESTVAEKLGDLMKRDRNPSVGTTVSGGVVSLRVNARFPDRTSADRELAKTIDACRVALGDLIYGADDDTLPAIVGALLKEKGLTVATAESCTGGLIAKYLTDVAGSSAYFDQAWITYANDAKTASLNVDPHLIENDGAVSESVVRAMAVNARTQSGSNVTLAVSGVAGPDGGTDAKPVGTVWIALAHGTAPRQEDPNVSEALARRFNFPGDREMVRDRAAKMALTMLRYHLLGKPLPF
ncbi:MAG: competence/damage-inducible protein A [Tepidisphaeraceae bacterium]